MNGVVIDVVIPVLHALKFHHKCVRDTILHNAIVPQKKPFWEKSEHTWSPSGELSVPPDADLIYGFLEIGCLQSSFNASIRLEIFNHRNFVRFRLSEIASGHIHH